MPVVAGCDHHGIDVRIIDERAEIDGGFCSWESFFGLIDTFWIRIAEADYLDRRNLFKRPHQLIRSTSTTEKGQSDFIVGCYSASENRSCSGTDYGAGRGSSEKIASTEWISMGHR
jgi:hypothetical protein